MAQHRAPFELRMGSRRTHASLLRPRRVVPLVFAALGLTVLCVSHWSTWFRPRILDVSQDARQDATRTYAHMRASSTRRGSEEEGVHAVPVGGVPGPPARVEPPPVLSRASLLAQLQRIETAHTQEWNHSKLLLLLGHKANRDFMAYAWAFRKHGYQVLQGPPLLYNRNGVFLDKKPLPKVAAVICHTVVTANCFREDAYATPNGFGGEQPKAGGGGAAPVMSQRFFALLPQSQKINRIAAVRATLTTKDGLCAAFKSSGLGPQQLYDFSFPCWALDRRAARPRPPTCTPLHPPTRPVHART